MTNGHKPLSDLLDEMALKILMIEPGDLSIVGELLDLIEQLLPGRAAADTPVVIQRMAVAFKGALEKFIMGELADSAENYEYLGQCITEMQESARKEGHPGENILAQFCDNMKKIGLAVDPSSLVGGTAAAFAGKGEEKDGLKAEEECLVAASSLASASAQPSGGGGAGQEAIPDFLQDTDLLAGFIEEAFEHLESIEVNVLELEQSPDDMEIINNIFRPFHTIKGVSGFLNLKTINRLAHATENLLDDVRNGKRPMDSAVIDIVLTVGDALKSMVEDIKDVLQNGPANYKDTDISGFLVNITRLQEGGAEAPPVEQISAPEPVSRPEVFDPEEEAEPPAVEEEAPVAPSRPATARGGVQPASVPRVEPPASSAARVSADSGSKKIGASIKVDVEKLDALVNAVGELVIMQSLVRQNKLVSRIADPKLTKDFSQLTRITSELQRTAMSMRMVPIKQTFDKMIRLVRDLSKKSGKKVDLIMEGADTEIDRNMVDSIYDPLVHMMRNSVDHGISPPADRAQFGKPETGTVHLRAYQKGGSMMIEIEDDGQGLNTTKIRQKAIERGLISESEALSDYELNNLIFLPGFSTAEKITDVSGRGVGMDVVKKAVEKLRGKVEVQSQSGKGSLFVIRLPLTLAIIDGIIVRVGSERYIIPTIAIQESMHPEEKNYSTVHGRGENLLVRGDLVPIIRLYEIFGVAPTYTDPCDAIVVVVENEGRRRALMVDELLGKEEVVIKNLGGLDVPGVAGGTILGDGRVGLILDLAGVMASKAD
ncbi:MAG: chemotaxis protein CheA [Proteobacteria bacterium]|nr:chemotaxis protein CheA [Pseudomonadota bacterium]MBU1545502.1 chemotaxis protein CheA [Pseudomonadota bacterium]MBU2620653.1 chemotaxis protein CheA [Pseudomonadota bacterium]